MNNCLYCGNPVKNKYCNVGCQNKHQNHLKADKKFGKYETFVVSCSKCQKEFEIEERIKLYPQKEKYYCSRNCANSRSWSDDDKKKISNGLKNSDILKNKYHLPIEYITIKCKNCDKDFTRPERKKSIFCSRSCCTIYYNRTTDRCNRAGLKSCYVQQETRRSKNEIYFSELFGNFFIQTVQ